MTPIYGPPPISTAYEAVRRKLDGDRCVIVDGGVATELERARASSVEARREPWGVWALYSAQTAVLDVHRRYVAAGCDVLSTNSWSILDEAQAWGGKGPSRAWEAAADAALALARAAVAESSREDDCAVAFCINGDLHGSRALGALELLTWRWAQEAPDLVIFETLEQLPGPHVLDAVGMVAECGLPVWVSMRRGSHGMASVDGRVTPDADPGLLPRAVVELERRGVSALLVNCVPRALVPDTVSALAAVSSLPVGCLPNLGCWREGRWAGHDEVSPDDFADEALEWLESGARIIGGCCGVGPEHIRAVYRGLDRAMAWSARGV